MSTASYMYPYGFLPPVAGYPPAFGSPPTTALPPASFCQPVFNPQTLLPATVFPAFPIAAQGTLPEMLFSSACAHSRLSQAC
jgi:hypothetical protein